MSSTTKYYNFSAFFQRYSQAIAKNIGTIMRNDTLRRACQLLNRFEEFQQEKAIRQWANDHRISTDMLRSFITGEVKDVELTASQRTREELMVHYVINQNVINQEYTIFYDGELIQMDELEVNLDDKALSTRHLKKFLKRENTKITVVNGINPLKDFFYQLAAEYKGEKMIDLLVDCMPIMDFGDRPKGYYEKRARYMVKKWLVKVVLQTLEFETNEVMLLFLEPNSGSGKSRLVRWLYSLPEFSGYTKLVLERESFMDFKTLSYTKLFIDFDELPLTKNRYTAFKSYIAAENVDTYDSKTKKHSQKPKYLNFIGSTNYCNRAGQVGFLLDNDDAIKRRMGTVELNGKIDYVRYLKEVNLRQLWGEAAAMAIQAQKTGNKQLLTWEVDKDELIEFNRRYVNIEAATPEQVISSHFPPVLNGEPCKIMQASEMLAQLDAFGVKHNLNPISLGIHLAQKNYTPARKNDSTHGWKIRKFQ